MIPEEIVFLPEVNAIIQMVRKIVKIFSMSPVNNNILQEEVIRLPERKGKMLKLQLDFKTRWNTIVGKNSMNKLRLKRGFNPRIV